jgi:hypothetical protein
MVEKRASVRRISVFTASHLQQLVSVDDVLQDLVESVTNV